MASHKIKERQMVWTCHKLSWHPVEAVFIQDNNLQIAGEHYLTREAVYPDSFAKMKVLFLGADKAVLLGIPRECTRLNGMPIVADFYIGLTLLKFSVHAGTSSNNSSESQHG